MRSGLKYYFKQIICLWKGHNYHAISPDLPNIGLLVECKRCHKTKII